MIKSAESGIIFRRAKGVSTSENTVEWNSTLHPPVGGYEMDY